MATYPSINTENVPTITQAILGKLARMASKEGSKVVTKKANRVQAWFLSFTRLVLTLAGFGFLTWGMFTWHIIAGLITAGLSCFVLSWLVKPESQIDNGNQPQAHTDALGYTTYR